MLSSSVKDSFPVWSQRVTEFRERAKSTLPIEVMVFQVIFKSLLAHADASCVKPLIAHGTLNGVLITSDGLLVFAARELYASLGSVGQD